jgi:hypothetical protein
VCTGPGQEQWRTNIATQDQQLGCLEGANTTNVLAPVSGVLAHYVCYFGVLAVLAGVLAPADKVLAGC